MCITAPDFVLLKIDLRAFCMKGEDSTNSYIPRSSFLIVPLDGRLKDQVVSFPRDSGNPP